jgi:FKBP-type peptidyl-prolyl cis-trans isomerase
VTTVKRERQRAGRIEKTIAQQTAAKRAKTRSTALRIGIATVVILGVLFAVSRLTGGNNDPDTATSEDTTPSTEEPSLGATIPETMTNPDLAAQVQARTPPTPTPPPADTPKDALETTTLIEGEGDGAVKGDTVTVHYVGVLSDGTEFDQSWNRGSPFPVTLGEGQVIEGWDEGLLGVKIGERRHLVIGADKAYGDAAQSAIPAGSPLAFDVDVVDVHHDGG